MRVRSDVERKRLAGLPPGARSATALGAGLYAPEMTARTYARLHDVAAMAIDGGCPVIVDAAMLKRALADSLRQLQAMKPKELLAARHARLLGYGKFKETTPEA